MHLGREWTKIYKMLFKKYLYLVNLTIFFIPALLCAATEIQNQCRFELLWGHTQDVHPESGFYDAHPDMHQRPVLIQGCSIGSAHQMGLWKDRKESSFSFLGPLRQVEGNGDYGGGKLLGNGNLNPISTELSGAARIGSYELVNQLYGLRALNGYLGFMRLTQYHYLWLSQQAAEQVKSGACPVATVQFRCLYGIGSDSSADRSSDSSELSQAKAAARYQYEQLRLKATASPLVKKINGHWELTEQAQGIKRTHTPIIKALSKIITWVNQWIQAPEQMKPQRRKRAQQAQQILEVFAQDYRAPASCLKSLPQRCEGVIQINQYVELQPQCEEWMRRQWSSHLRLDHEGIL